MFPISAMTYEKLSNTTQPSSVLFKMHFMAWNYEQRVRMHVLCASACVLLYISRFFPLFAGRVLMC